MVSSNELPLDVEKVALTRFIADGVKRLSVRNNQIAHARRVLEDFVCSRDALQRDIEERRVIMNPARRLPTEILTQIFLLCIDEAPRNDASPHTNSLDYDYMPWRIAQVSRRWRAVALSFPRLWSTIRIKAKDGDLEDATTCRKWELHLGAQLHRSSTHNLDVSVDTASKILPSHPLLRILLPSSPRWKHLFLRVPRQSFRAFSGIRGFLQSMKTLAVYSDAIAGPVSHVDPSYGLSNVFEYAPMLRVVAGDPSVLRFCRLPWAQIVSYSNTCNHNAVGPERHHIVELLRLIPNIEKCELTLWTFPQGPSPSGFPPVECRHLRSLKVTQNLLPHLSEVLDNLILPSLEILTMDTMPGVLTGPLLDFITRTQASLRCLTLYTPHISALKCWHLLDSLSSLNKLVLGCPMTSFATLLSDFGSVPTTAPSLQYLTTIFPFPSDQAVQDELVKLNAARPHLFIGTEEIVS